MTKLEEKRNLLIFRGYIAQLTNGLALMTLIVASAETFKSLFVHAKYTRAHCIRKMHVLNKFAYAVIIPINRDESASHRKCSHLSHTCLQCNSGLCRMGDFHEG